MWPLFYTKGVKWGLSLQKRAVIFSALLCHVSLGQSCVTSIPFSPLLHVSHNLAVAHQEACCVSLLEQR